MEFEVMGITYKVNKIPAMKQFHIVRRLLPVLSELAPAASKGTSGADVLPLLSNTIAKMADEDADYCIYGLLAAVQRNNGQGLGWAPVSADRALMYSDMTMAVVLQLAWRALTHNLSDFFAALPSDLKDAAQKLSAQSIG